MPSFSGEFPRQFDVVSDLSDHDFAGKPPIALSPTSSVHKKIMQEWKLLSKHLPESIYVRVYETRVDLLRAAIVGTRGTPYHDGLFFFDVAFPSDYPARPPSVSYKSFGYRINPNLYTNGRVCLSLLNTWSGKKCEKWDPENSTILQLLLSIQALVLNERPYFNEPGYSAWSGRAYGEKKSLEYNEEVFVLSCRTMLRVLRKPPMNFALVVIQHFKYRAEFILNACDAYRKGFVRVGFFHEAVKGTEGEVPVKYTGAVDQVFGDLVLAMSKTGAYVEHFVEQLREEKEKKAEEEAAAAAAAAATAAKNRGGFNAREIGKNIVKTLKKIVALGQIMKKKVSN